MSKNQLLTTAAMLPEIVMPADQKSGPNRIELPPDLHANRLVDSATAAATLNYSLAHFRRLYRAGKLPQPVRINGRKLGWPVSVLQGLLICAGPPSKPEKPPATHAGDVSVFPLKGSTPETRTLSVPGQTQ